MQSMLQFLKSAGLKEFQFIIINAKDLDAREKFNDLAAKVSFPVYQETDEEIVWDVIDGGRDDMFIYDRLVIHALYIIFQLNSVLYLFI